MLRAPSGGLAGAGFHDLRPRAEAPFLSGRPATVVVVMDDGGIKVSLGEVLGVFGGSVLLVAESTLYALSRTAHEEFVEAAEKATGAVVFVVPDAVFTADV